MKLPVIVLIALFSIASNLVGEASSQLSSAEVTVEQGTEIDFLKEQLTDEEEGSTDENFSDENLQDAEISASDFDQERGNVISARLARRRKRAAIGAALAAVGKEAAMEVGKELVTDLLKRGTTHLNSQLDIMFGGVVSDIKDKTRALSVTIVNNSPNTLSFRRVWFESGKVFHAFNNYEIPPKGYTVGYFSNVDGGFMTGVTGMAEFEGSDGRWFYIGFSNPYVGSAKMCCIVYPHQFRDSELGFLYTKYVRDGNGENNSVYSTAKDNKEGFPRITVEIKK